MFINGRTIDDAEAENLCIDLIEENKELKARVDALTMSNKMLDDRYGNACSFLAFFGKLAGAVMREEIEPYRIGDYMYITAEEARKRVNEFDTFYGGRFQRG